MTADRRKLVAILVATANAVLAPRPQLTVSEWADQHRVIASSTSAEPGRWRTDRTPYLREIMDTLGDREHTDVVFMKASRVGGSECGNNFLGYLIDYDPCGVLVAYPSDDAKKTWSKEYLDPLIESSPALRGKVTSDGPRREKGNTISRKTFAGGYLGILSAGSTKQLRFRTARVVVGEEIDDWEEDVGDQGDPLSLLSTRTDTYGDLAKRYKVSSPTVEGASRIADEYQLSDQRRYHVPCPHCGEYQELMWRDEKEQYRLVCDADEQGHPIPETARYLCGSCGALIDESEKTGMLARGRWHASNPQSRIAGFHISQLYSPFTSWAQIMRKFLAAKSNPSKLKVFQNTVLGLPYDESGGEKIDQHYLAARVESYNGFEVPPGVVVLTAGIDKQSRRLEVAVWGWGAELESWLIGWFQLHGDTGRPEKNGRGAEKTPDVYDDLDELLQRDWKHALGGKLRIAAAGFDAGDDAHAVTWYCESRRGKLPVFSLLGRGGAGLPLIQTPSDILQQRKSSKWKRQIEGPKHHIVGADSLKDDLLGPLGRIRVKEPGPRYVHFPAGTDPVFFDQLTSERKVPRRVGSTIKRVWKKLEGRNNEALDITLYARAALQRLGQEFINSLGERGKQMEKRARPGAEVERQAPASAPPPPVKKNRRTSWRGVDW